MEEKNLVPDGIQPVIGWRCFKLVNGYLVSPQRNTVWKLKKAATAECATFHSDPILEWIARIKPATPDQDILEAFGSDALKDKPTLELPEELAWDLVKVEREATVPFDNCNCGIHLAKELIYAITFFTQGPVMIVGKVAGWGKVIEGTKGYRVQYAYPIELFVGSKYRQTEAAYLGENTIAWLQAYGVPVYVIEALVEAESKEARVAIQRILDGRSQM